MKTYQILIIVSVILIAAIVPAATLQAKDIYLPIVDRYGPVPLPVNFVPSYPDWTGYTVLEWWIPAEDYAMCWLIRINWTDGTDSIIRYCEDEWQHG